MYKKKHKGITKDGGEGQVDTYPNTRKWLGKSLYIRCFNNPK
jgi:hypothetical protein